MDPMKMKLLEELMEHIDNHQGMGLKSMLMDSQKPPGMSGMMGMKDDQMGNLGNEPDDDDDTSMLMGKPKGLKIESMEIMGKKDPMDPMKDPMDGPVTGENGDHPDEEMSDEELKELIKQYLS